MSREEFVKLEQEIGVRPYWEGLREEAGKRKNIIFSLRAFKLGPKALKDLLEQGDYNFVTNPRTKITEFTSIENHYQEIYQLFDFQDELTVVVGHLDPGWKSLAVSRFDGADELHKPLHLISKDRKENFSFIVVQYELEQGGFMATCFGARNHFKNVKQEIEIRMIHNYGLCIYEDLQN